MFRGSVARPCLRALLLFAELSKVPVVPASVCQALAPTTFALHQLPFLLLPNPVVHWAFWEAQQGPETTALSFPAMKSVLSLSLVGTLDFFIPGMSEQSPPCLWSMPVSQDGTAPPEMEQEGDASRTWAPLLPTEKGNDKKGLSGGTRKVRPEKAPGRG